MDVSGLAPNVATFPYNSAQRELLSKARRNSALCRSARLVAPALIRMIAQEAMENKRRISSTPFVMGLARITRSRRVLRELSVWAVCSCKNKKAGRNEHNNSETFNRFYLLKIVRASLR